MQKKFITLNWFKKACESNKIFIYDLECNKLRLAEGSICPDICPFDAEKVVSRCVKGKIEIDSECAACSISRLENNKITINYDFTVLEEKSFTCFDNHFVRTNNAIVRTYSSTCTNLLQCKKKCVLITSNKIDSFGVSKEVKEILQGEKETPNCKGMLSGQDVICSSQTVAAADSQPTAVYTSACNTCDLKDVSNLQERMKQTSVAYNEEFTPDCVEMYEPAKKSFTCDENLKPSDVCVKKMPGPNAVDTKSAESLVSCHVPSWLQANKSVQSTAIFVYSCPNMKRHKNSSKLFGDKSYKSVCRDGIFMPEISCVLSEFSFVLSNPFFKISYLID